MSESHSKSFSFSLDKIQKLPRPLVFTNGCFDLLHVGHVRYLQQARALGKSLVVGLNSDKSVSRLKGPSRPLQKELDRAEILKSLEAVSDVVIFEEDTPLDLIQKINPDVLVKGGDWPIQQIVGASWVQAQGGKVYSLPLVQGRSTTGILEKSLNSSFNTDSSSNFDSDSDSTPDSNFSSVGSPEGQARARNLVSRTELASRVFRTCYLTGDFLLRSGQRSHEYFDKYRLESDPQLLRLLAQGLAPLIPEDTEVLAGLELGGVPVATALSLHTGLPACFVRKKAKPYGTCQVAEGLDLKSKKVCVIEDVITTGGQVLLSAQDILKSGAQLTGVLCLIYRGPENENPLSSLQVPFKSLFKASELLTR